MNRFEYNFLFILVTVYVDKNQRNKNEKHTKNIQNLSLFPKQRRFISMRKEKIKKAPLISLLSPKDLINGQLLY